ncbi:hypothetical protein NW767_013254 [Fusarium falciforme]|nr:hypothetical protein NW767_013254 [Fusarium falciforme]
MTGAPSQATARAASSRKRSRAVSNLTEEQIQHKRNVDRRAQRAFRQRNKECITNLELQFSQLQGTCAELRETCSQKDAQIDSMRDENQSLISCLEAISELVTKALRQAGKTHDRDAHDQDTSRDESQIGGQQTTTGTPSRQEEAEDDPVPVALQECPELQQDSGHARRSHTEEPFDDQLVQCQSSPTPTNHAGPVHDQPYNIPDDMGNEDAICHVSPAANAGFLSPPGSHRAPDSHIPYSTSSQSGTEASHVVQHDTTEDYSGFGGSIANVGHYTPSNAVFGILPAHVPSTCPLDLILLEFLKSRREMLSNGLDLDSIVGPPRPSTRALVNPEQVDSVHPLSGIMSRVLSTFPSVQLAEKLAFFYLMCHTMRWQIHPTKQHYTDMPSWLRPTVTQIAVPHAAWIDNIPWPGVRDILIENQAEYPFQLFSDYYSQNVSVNWKFDGLDAVSDLNGEGTLHSIFERHIRDLRNWTVSKAFQDRFPSMTGVITDITQ